MTRTCRVMITTAFDLSSSNAGQFWLLKDADGTTSFLFFNIQSLSFTLKAHCFMCTWGPWGITCHVLPLISPLIDNNNNNNNNNKNINNTLFNESDTDKVRKT